MEIMLRAALDTHSPGRIPDLELICLRDAAIARLNADCLGCAGPTNILAWPPARTGAIGFSEGTEQATLGTIVLSVDAVRREARLYGQDPAAYCRRLLAHGLAHVLGYDHGPGMDALCARMLEHAG
jgi:probable rRNA maturation factor